MKHFIVYLLSFLLAANKIAQGQTILTNGNNDPVEGFGLVKDPNSNTVYFGKTDSISSTAIYKGMLSDGKINSISRYPMLSTISQETIPFFSTDGKYIFMFSNFGNPDPRNLDLWFGKYDKKGMNHNLKKALAVNTDSVEYYGSMSAGDDLYFSSWRNTGYGKGDIFSTRFRKGKFYPVKHLDSNINTQFINSSPAISPNGDWVIFFNEKDNVADLYISFLSMAKWSKPIKLSNLVNTANFEFAPVIGDNGKSLYFSRREKSTSSDKLVYHMYKIAIAELELDKLKRTAVY